MPLMINAANVRVCELQKQILKKSCVCVANVVCIILPFHLIAQMLPDIHLISQKKAKGL